MSHKSTLPILIALLVAHMVLAAGYLLQTPYRKAGIVTTSGPAKDIGAPDERQHANYIGRLIRREGYPVFKPSDPNLYENYQAHQPPLYYTIAAAWSDVFSVTDVQGPDDGRILRALNILIGATGVLGVFFLAMWGYHRDRMALTAAAIAALLPMNAALSGAISNDPLLICLCTWVLAILARVVRGHWNMRRAIVLGVLIGAAILTKTTAVALLPVVALAMLLHRPKWEQGVTVWAIALGIGLPWWIRNQMLYGDPFAMQAFTQAFVGSAQRSVQFGSVGDWDYWVNFVGFWTVRSFVGVFGYMDIWLTQSGRAAASLDENRLYWVCIFFLLVGAIGWLLSFRDESFKNVPKVRILNGAFFLVVLLLFIRFNSTYFQAQARYLYPAIGPIACGLAAGYRELSKKRKEIPIIAVVVFLLIVNMFALIRLGPAFDQRVKAGAEVSSTVG